MNFDEMIDRVGTGCVKWDKIDALYGVPPQNGIAMWVADMDFRPPACVQSALQGMLDHGLYGYTWDDDSYLDAVRWWMDKRHGWQVARDEIFTTHGLVNGTAMCVHTFTQPGDAVVLMTPVYHAFARVIKAAGRELRECPMPQEEGRYVLDIAAMDAAMTGRETMMILCSPHNPGGRVWRRDELEQIADFAHRHDLILVSDEIHHDLVFGGHKHIPMANIDGVRARLVMLCASSKTFNLAGGHTGNVIIHDPDLRKRFAAAMEGMGMSANSFGIAMARAAYSAEGAAWLNALLPYLDENRRVFDAAIAQIPGAVSMPLEATYLAWVDFSGTGLPHDELIARVQGQAKIAANHGTSFGTGGEGFLRFNLATQRARVAEAAARLRGAFGDLQ